MSAITPFPQLLHAFFYDWLIEQRDTSRHTITAYRNTWRLFLRFVAQRHQKVVAKLN
jgi:site-specific recombinase XerD